jgi:hypothetical protein
MRKVTAFILIIAIISTLGISVTAIEEPQFPNYYTDGELTIGFFNFVDGRGTHLEVRLQRTPAGFGITQSYSLSGITRVRDMHPNDDLFEGFPGVPRPNQIVLAGGITQDFEFSPGEIAALASVDGTGTISFGEGEFAILWPDGTSTLYDLSGVTLSNIEIITPEVTEPVATETTPPTTTTTTTITITTPTEENPNTGVVFPLIPVIIAGTALFISRIYKRIKH